MSTKRIFNPLTGEFDLVQDQPENNLAGIIAPTANDDSSAGYAVGSEWIDTVASKAYVCVDISVGSAVWVETTALISGSANPGGANGQVQFNDVGVFGGEANFQFDKINKKLTVIDKLKAGYGALDAIQEGSIALGYAGGGYSFIESSAKGALAGGYCKSFDPYGSYYQYLKASGIGSVALGLVTGDYETATLESSGYGAFAMGWVYAHGVTTITEASGYGAFAIGCNMDGEILSSGSGALAGGFCLEKGKIEAIGAGAFAFGDCEGQGKNSLIQATQGAWAGGYASGSSDFGEIKSTAKGSFAFGYCYENDIIASASNTIQFGVGTNNEADTLQVGSGIRIKGTDGVPSDDLHNGDQWVDNGYVYIRSNGQSVKIS